MYEFGINSGNYLCVRVGAFDKSCFALVGKILLSCSPGQPSGRRRHYWLDCRLLGERLECIEELECLLRGHGGRGYWKSQRGTGNGLAVAFPLFVGGRGTDSRSHDDCGAKTQQY